MGKAAGRERVRRRAHRISAKTFDSKNGGTPPRVPLPTLRTKRQRETRSAQAGRDFKELERRRVKVMAKFAKELITSLTQAAKHARGGKVKGMRVTAVELPDVKAIRRSLRMSQNRFSAAYRIPLATLKNWEQGRRHPDAPAAAYLLAIKRKPKEIREAVAH